MLAVAKGCHPAGRLGGYGSSLAEPVRQLGPTYPFPPAWRRSHRCCWHRRRRVLRETCHPAIALPLADFPNTFGMRSRSDAGHWIFGPGNDGALACATVCALGASCLWSLASNPTRSRGRLPAALRSVRRRTRAQLFRPVRISSRNLIPCPPPAAPSMTSARCLPRCRDPTFAPATTRATGRRN